VVKPPQNPTIRPVVSASDGSFPAEPNAKIIPAMAQPAALMISVLAGKSPA
jgi:hypothetical protein